MSLHEDFIAKLLGRTTPAATQFGYGLSTAQPYVKGVVDALGPALCAEQFKMSDTDAAIAEAKGRATYANDDLVFEEKATSSSRFKDLLPDGIEAPKHTAMVFRHVLTSTKEDRDNDILETKGAVLDPKAPLLWQHIPNFPIGKVLATIEHTDQMLKVSSALLDMNDMTADALKLIEAEVLRISHGFRALEFEERKDSKNMGPPGFRITKMEIMEASIVSVPSNTDAEIEVFSTAKFASPVFKAYQQKLHDARPVQVPVNTQLTLKLGDASVTLSRGVDLSDKQADVVDEVVDEVAEETVEMIEKDDIKTTEDDIKKDVSLDESADIPVETIEDIDMEDDVKTTQTDKAGRALSASNRKMLEDVRDDVKEIQGMDGMPRAANALCERCVGKLDKMIGAGMDDEEKPKPEKPDEDGKSEQVVTTNSPELTYAKAAAHVLQYGTPDQLKHLKNTLAALETADALNVKAAQYRVFTG